MQVQDSVFLEVRFNKKSARKNPRGKNAATRLPKNVTVFYCGGGLLIGPGMWLTIYMAYFFPDMNIKIENAWI